MGIKLNVDSEILIPQRTHESLQQAGKHPVVSLLLLSSFILGLPEQLLHGATNPGLLANPGILFSLRMKRRDKSSGCQNQMQSTMSKKKKKQQPCSHWRQLVLDGTAVSNEGLIAN